jgi:hypothetical protein
VSPKAQGFVNFSQALEDGGIGGLLLPHLDVMSCVAEARSWVGNGMCLAQRQMQIAALGCKHGRAYID